jgi:hypothetical protein
MPTWKKTKISKESMTIPITLKDMRELEYLLQFRLNLRYSKKLARRLRLLRLKIERKSLRAAKYYSNPQNIRTEW